MEFIVPGRCIPAPRMTRYSRSSPRTIRYMEYREAVAFMALLAKVKRIPKGVPVGILMEIHLCRKGRTGDLDNYQKTILDALNGVAWDDDRQVEAIQARKVWVADQKEEKVLIKIWELEVVAR